MQEGHDHHQPMLSTDQERKEMKALVAIDGSDESLYALNWFLDKFLLQINGADSSVNSTSVTLVHVMEPLPHYAFPGGFGI